MRSIPFALAAALAALAVPAPAAAQRQAPVPETGWVTRLFIQRLEDGFADRPETARMSGHRQSPWATWARARGLPAGLGDRPLVADSFVILDVGGAGEATGCRTLRAGAEPRLDAFACALLMQPGYFQAYLIPPVPPAAPARWVVGLRFQTLSAAALAALEARYPRPAIAPAPPAPPLARARPSGEAAAPAPAAPPSTGQRRAVQGHLVATDYRGIADRRIGNGDFLAELAVDAQGVPTGCRVVRSSGNEAVDARTCALLLEKARYTLRADAAGALIADTVRQPVDLGWVLGPPPAPR